MIAVRQLSYIIIDHIKQHDQLGLLLAFPGILHTFHLIGQSCRAACQRTLSQSTVEVRCICPTAPLSMVHSLHYCSTRRLSTDSPEYAVGICLLSMIYNDA